MQNIAVSGAAGFIGLRLCQSLKEQGYHVLALLHRPASGPWHRALNMDLSTSSPSISDLAGIDTIFHLAGKAHAVAETAQDADSYMSINADATQRLLHAAKAAGVRRFVYFSSVKAICDGVALDLDETSACTPTTPYGQSKLAAELHVLQGAYVPEPVVLRPSMVYGPSEKGNLPRLIQMIRKGLMPPLPEFANRRSMIHVDDVVRAAICAGEHAQAAGKIYILTDGKNYSSRQIYEGICLALQRSIPAWSIPVFLLKILATSGDIIGWAAGRRPPFDSTALLRLRESSSFCSNKIRNELGFIPEHDLFSFLKQYLKVNNADSSSD